MKSFRGVVGKAGITDSPLSTRSVAQLFGVTPPISIIMLMNTIETAVYTLRIPSFHISNTRALRNDTLSASTALKVMNANGGLHHDWQTQGVSLGDHKKGEDVALNLTWQNIDIPAPTPENPDGGAIYWSFLLVNKGHTDSAWVAALEKAVDSVAQQLANKAVAAIAGGGGLAWLISNSAQFGLQELMNVLTADCDGTVAAGAFAFTAAQLAEMAPNPNQSWNYPQNNPGTDSQHGCGANSDYQISYVIERVP